MFSDARAVYYGPSEPTGQATILLVRGQHGFDETDLQSTKVSITTPSVEEIYCSTSSTVLFKAFQYGLIQFVANVSISISIQSENTGYYIVPAQGDLAPEVAALILATGLGGVPLFPGSRLAGIFTWTRRDMIVASVLSHPATVYTPDISGLQTSGIPEPSVATLNLFQWLPEATRILQDTADSTAIAGIATFGGVWTILNGAFALFFGANVLYFLFGRRPLSALGLVHTFQRRRLIGYWHEDFPAIHTEGGLPGSESAGIVAFIRERLVDLDNDPPATPDVEAQMAKAEDVDETEETATDQLSMVQHDPQMYLRLPARESGYILDEIPLTDVDLGMDEIVHNSTNFASPPVSFGM
ncbi:hypothetical protein B0H19DRAFT_1253146 [Mycena capillaripes]|nr:hypothetical protein B0H19DRAFT_1253146 [Mycena capillaripes]